MSSVYVDLDAPAGQHGDQLGRAVGGPVVAPVAQEQDPRRHPGLVRREERGGQAEDEHRGEEPSHRHEDGPRQDGALPWASRVW